MNLFAAIALGAIGTAGFYLMPLIVGAAADALSLDPREQGLVASAELAGMTLSSIGAVLWSKHVERRVQTALGLAVLLVGNLASVLANDFEFLLAVRLLTGIGGGMILAAAMESLAGLPNPDRSYGFLIAAEYGLAAVGFIALPRVVLQYGLPGLFGALALLVLLAAPLVRAIPDGEVPSAASADRASRAIRGSAAANVVAVAFFSIGFSAVWAYVERIGSTAGLGPQAIGSALALGSGMSVLGALSVASIGGRSGRLPRLTLAAAVQTLVLLNFFGELEWVRYAASVAALSFFWNVTFPTIFSNIAELDRTGSWVVRGNVAAFAGTAAGPAAAGMLLSTGDLAVVSNFGAVLMGLCWGALLIASRLSVAEPSLSPMKRAL